jgi:hypothetical protein
MRAEQAGSAAAFLASYTTGWDDDAVEAYAMEFMEWEDDRALEKAIRSVAKSWTNYSRPPLAIIHDAYCHELSMARLRSTEQLANSGVIRCGGHLWVYQDGKNVPCPTCCHGLHRVWTQGNLLEQYRRGTTLKVVLGYEDDDQFWRETASPACLPFEAFDRQRDRNDRMVSPNEGKEIAARSYEAGCVASGTVPNWTHFNMALGIKAES